MIIQYYLTTRFSPPPQSGCSHGTGRSDSGLHCRQGGQQAAGGGRQGEGQAARGQKHSARAWSPAQGGPTRGRRGSHQAKWEEQNSPLLLLRAGSHPEILLNNDKENVCIFVDFHDEIN